MKRVAIAAALVVAVGLVCGVAPAGAVAAGAAHDAAAAGHRGAVGVRADARTQFTARRLEALEALRAASGQPAASTARPVVTSVSPVGGPLGGGTTITVHGSSFAGIQSVTIGGRKARSFHVKSATVLTAPGR